MKSKPILLLFGGIMAILALTSYGQTAPVLDSLSADPTVVLMYQGEPFPYPSGVAMRFDQWEYFVKRERYNKAIEIAVRAQIMPSVSVPPPPAVSLTPDGYRKTVKTTFWVGFGLGVLGGIIIQSAL